ncbi:MAG: pilus assembly PilX N-terminal domain-containing protein [Candidatus Paceibacterota bacterium]|jgi:Tfp pilus assembly protein PilX
MNYTSHTSVLHRGYVLVLALVFLGIFFTVSGAYLSSVTSSARIARYDIASAQALALAEAGIDKAVYQLNQNPSYTGETNTTLAPGMFTVTVSAIDGTTKQIISTGFIPNSTNPVATKTIKANIGINNSIISFHYGIQSGNGGFEMENNSTVTGNVFSGGSVIGGSENDILGDVVSSGDDGLVYGIHATGSVYSHTIGNSSKSTTIDKDAYYHSSKTNTTVGGTSHPNSVDQSTAPLPISDDQISRWETIAAAGGTATCHDGSYNISSGNVTLGPIKIPCDLNITNGPTVTINGHIWVTGNINVQNTATIKMAASLGAQNIALIADDPTDLMNGSRISVGNQTAFQNSGTPGSFIFLISQNKSAENGGEVAAFDLSNSASALVAYAAHGLIPLANSVSLKEVTAYKITLKNSANVTYDTGLPSVAFESGPGGSWNFIPGTYTIQ